LREVYLKYPIDQLESGFAEGMGSRHRDMPQIQFSTEQVAAILSYLGGITGVDPPTTAAPIPARRRPRRSEPRRIHASFRGCPAAASR
jgi:hypothetical protein